MAIYFETRMAPDVRAGEASQGHFLSLLICRKRQSSKMIGVVTKRKISESFFLLFLSLISATWTLPVSHDAGQLAPTASAQHRAPAIRMTSRS